MSRPSKFPSPSTPPCPLPFPHFPSSEAGPSGADEPHSRSRFIDDLARESLTGATHDFASRSRSHSRRSRSRSQSTPRGPSPVLNDRVHSLLASWAVAFFAPRGIRVYAAQDGRRVIPTTLEPDSHSNSRSNRHGHSRADEWSDEDSEWSESDTEARREDAYLPRREREVRSEERARERRRERRRRDLDSVQMAVRGEWEVHFVMAEPTLWTPGARPRTYGEPTLRLRR